MSHWTETRLGKEILTKDGKIPTSSLVDKKLIGVYFSAHWCPPCRGFTPVLAEFYDDLKERDADTLEIIFVSSDNDAHSFAEYYGSMPWAAVPFENSEIGQNLSQNFGVRGIPTFIILSGADGSIVDKDGRSTVATSKGNIDIAKDKWLKELSKN